MTTKTDKKGEFVQLLTASGMYRVTASEPKVGSASNDTKVVLGKVSEMTIVLAPSTAANDSAKAAELKKAFEEGVTASRAGQHDAAIEKFTAALAISPACFDCQFNIGVALMAKKDEKGAEEAWKKALEMKPDYAEPLNALSTLYNNQKRFDEAAAMSAKAAAGGGSGGADATFNQGIILWNQGKIAEAKVKFEETIKMNATPCGRALSARHGALERRQADRSGHRVRNLREAGARWPVRHAGERDDRATEKVKKEPATFFRDA